MEKIEKKSFWSKILGKGRNAEAKKGLYSNPKQAITKIKLALLDLLSEKEIANINVTHLVKVAGVYRATFYLHFKNLNDVVNDIQKDIYNCYNTIREQAENVDIISNITQFFDIMKEYVAIEKRYVKTTLI